MHLMKETVKEAINSCSRLAVLGIIIYAEEGGIGKDKANTHTSMDKFLDHFDNATVRYTASITNAQRPEIVADSLNSHTLLVLENPQARSSWSSVEFIKCSRSSCSSCACSRCASSSRSTNPSPSSKAHELVVMMDIVRSIRTMILCVAE